MNYEDALSFIHKAEKYGSVLGLENMFNLMNKLDNVQNNLKVIHIAGTNGKGSVGAFIGSVLKHSGFKTGRYISPTIFEYLERFQINDTIISKELFCNICGKVKEAVYKIVGEGKSHPTAFEIETAIAFLYFYEESCDFVLLETGLGGRLDATNVLNENVCSVITSISIDHTLFLGNSVVDIAKEKCGIIKENCPVISIEQVEDVNNVIKKECYKKNSPVNIVFKKDIVYGGVDGDIQYFGYKNYKDIKIKLLGKFQIENAALAIGVVEILIKQGYNITEENIYSGLIGAFWQGRFQILKKNPIFIIDGAHNFDAVERMCETIELYFKNKRLIFIVGIFKDKEYKKITKMTADLAEEIYTVDLKNPRGLSGKDLAEEFLKYNKNTKTTNSLFEAIHRSILSAGENGVVIAFGSLSYLGEVVGIIKNMS